MVSAGWSPYRLSLIHILTKTVARLYLAKAYLTYAWWLKNPNNIPTYPECQRTDPDGHDRSEEHTSELQSQR